MENNKEMGTNKEKRNSSEPNFKRRKAFTTKDITDEYVTPFNGKILERACQILVELPKVGDPYVPKRTGRVNGENYEQMKEYLLPVIVSMFEKGYNRDMVVEKTAELLKVGRSNIFVKKVVLDSHKAYIEKLAKRRG